ncbi:hypothetical protein D3C71_1472980 [compost metagenome]
MNLNRGAVALGARYSDLELARQERELRMHGRPLTQDFRIRTRIGDLVCGGAREMVGGHVANAVTRGLQRMHFHACQFGEDIGRVGQARPVVLDVLAGGEVAVTPVIFAGDMGQHPHLLRIQRAVGNGDAQHIGMELEIDTVHKAQRLERVLGKLAGQPALDLIAKLCHAAFNKCVIELVVTVHILPQTAMNAASAGLKPLA